MLIITWQEITKSTMLCNNQNKSRYRADTRPFVFSTRVGLRLTTGWLPFAFDKIRDDGLLSVVIVVTPLTAIMKDQVLDTLFALVLLLFSCTLDHLRQPATPRQPHQPRQKLLPYWSWPSVSARVRPRLTTQWPHLVAILFLSCNSTQYYSSIIDLILF